MPFLTAYYGNPHSRTHMYGWETETAVELARKVNIIYNTMVFFQRAIV